MSVLVGLLGRIRIQISKTFSSYLKTFMSNVDHQCITPQLDTVRILMKYGKKLAYIIIRHELTGRLNAGGSSCQD